jgi:hypothetical protein
MPKAPTPTSSEKPKVLDVLVAVTEKILDFRYDGVRAPNLVDIGRCTIAASRALHVRDVDERISCENACVMQIARKRQLVS